MLVPALFMLLTVQASDGSAPVGPLRIAQARLSCVSRETHPRVEASVAPAAQVAAVTLHFRSAKAPGFYAVALQREGDVYSGHLPRPRWLDQFTYYVEAVDLLGTSVKGPERAAAVARKDGCTKGKDAATVVVRNLIVHRPQGSTDKTPIVPPGFSVRGTAGDIGMAEVSGRTSFGITAAILGGIGAAATALSVGNNNPSNPNLERPPVIYAVRFQSSSPPPGGTVSLSAPFALNLRVEENIIMNYTGRRATALSVAFVPTGGNAPCATLTYRHPINSFSFLPDVNITALPTVSSSCALPFTTDTVLVTPLGSDLAPIADVPSQTLSLRYSFVP